MQAAPREIQTIQRYDCRAFPSKLKQNEKQLGLAVWAFFIARKVTKHAMWSWTPSIANGLFLYEPEWAQENARAAQETKPAKLLISPHISSEKDFYLVAIKSSEFTATVWC